MPKWDKSEQEMLAAQFAPVTLSWPLGAEVGSMRMGGIGPKDRLGFEEGMS